MIREPIVPDFTPVTPEQFRGHLDSCPDCQGPIASWCPEGKRLFDAVGREIKREAEKRDKAQAWDLIHAGWRFEVPGDTSDVMSWYWRSPPRRKGSGGKLHRSTNQAWRAMKRAASEDPDATA